MEDYSLALKKLAKFPKPFPENHANEEKAGFQPEGGTFRNGEYGWLSAGSYLEIVEMNSGFKVSRFDFTSQFGNVFVQISTIVDVELPDFVTPVLAIGFRTDTSDSGFICLFSVHGSRPLQILEFPDNVSVLHPLLNVPDDQEDILYRDFDGCLIVGFDSGKTALIDLKVRELQQRLLQSKSPVTEPVPCITIPSDASEEEIRRCHNEAHREKCGFGLDLKVLEDAGPVLSLLPLPQMRTLAVGLCDGRLVLYHLDRNMEAFHLALPPEPMSPLVGMAFMEPADDPKACAYLWAFHETPEMAIAVMHSLVFETRRSRSHSPGSTPPRESYVYERFQSCRVRLTLPIEDRGSVPISCQAICQPLSSSEESLTCVCLLAWRTERKTSMLMLFDLNQWYKEQMPWVGNWRDMPRYVAIFPLNEDPLAVRLDARSLSWFNSLERPEEHFYPTAMGFDCLMLSYKGSCRYHWPGLQNRALNMLEYCGPNAILEPDMCYRAMLNATLIPQFSEDNFKLDSSLAKKRELLLSIALEYNCVGLLKRCARVWSDGSHMGRDPSRGLSLATLTDWIWSRSLTIKQYCNAMCVPLFDYSGQQLGTAEQKRLSHCGVQLKWLSEIMEMIMRTCGQYIPEDILDQLKEQQQSIQIAAEYQEVLVWMFNMGLLPECNGTTNITRGTSLDSSVASAGLGAGEDRPNVSMVYPYELLNNFYHQKREQFFEADRKYAVNSPTWNSCSMLYIDALIDRECGGVGLFRDWREDGGTGLYPPRSLQSMLRVLLLPNVSIQSKYSIFMYLFMDLNVVYQDHECRSLVQNLYKFPTAFKMPKDVIKLIESFWHLDHNNFEEAVVDLKAASMTKWQLELMVECLFLHQCAQLSLRALRMPGPSISPVIEMRVLLGNNLISEAFLFQKKHGDKTLLMEFFNSCYKLGSLRSILRLPLTETEGQLLGEFLLSVDSTMTRNLHFVYLLQRSKYVEAVDLVEQLRLKRSGQPAIDTGSMAAVLTAYRKTMPPLYQEISDIYKKTGGGTTTNMSMSMDSSSRNAMATPLSSQLIRNKVDVNSSVYQMAITAVKEATNYSLFQGQQTRSPNKFTSIPFLRKPLQENMHEYETSSVIYPKIVEGPTEKIKRGMNDTGRDESFAKRRKLDDINAGLLTSFQPTKVDTLDFSGVRKKTDAVSSVLTTPIVKRVMNTSTSNNTSPRALAQLTPHSILKARNIFRESPAPDEKVLRFKPSVSPCIFDVSAIKKSEDSRSRPVAFDGPKPRRSIRSVTPEENILSSTRNQIETEEVRPVAKKLARLEEEMMSKMSAVEAEVEEAEKAKSHAVQANVEHSAMRNVSPQRELRSRSKDRPSEPQATHAEESAAPKFIHIAPRRSLRSRTPEQVSPRRTITTTTTTSVTRSTTKKTLTRMVLESNAKRNLLERPEEIAEVEDAASSACNTTLDSTLPMSDYSLNLDPLAGERTILTDNSCISESMLGEWRERRGGEVERDSFVSDISELPSVADVLVDTPNQSFQFVAPQINESLEVELQEKLSEVDQLREDTVYQPETKRVEAELPETVNEAHEEEDVASASRPLVEEDKSPVEEKPLEDPFKVPSPPKKSYKQPLLVGNQDTFIVGGQTPMLASSEDRESSPPAEDYYDSDSDLSNLSNKSDDSLKLDTDSSASLSDGGSLDDNLYEEDYPNESDHTSEGDEPAAKPFKTNEVIDLLDSSNDDSAGDGAVEEHVGEDIDSDLDCGSAVDSESEGLEMHSEGDAEEVDEAPQEQVDYVANEQTYDVVQPIVPQQMSMNKSLESPQFQRADDDSPERMEAEEVEQQLAQDIYEDMDVDVVGDDNGEGGLNDALMIDETSKDAVFGEMCLQIDEDSMPETREQVDQTLAGESTVNLLDKAAVMDDTVEEEEEREEEQQQNVEVVADIVEVSEEVQQEEVTEVIPPPKVAYVTTTSEESKEQGIATESGGGEIAAVMEGQERHEPEETEKELLSETVDTDPQRATKTDTDALEKEDQDGKKAEGAEKEVLPETAETDPQTIPDQRETESDAGQTLEAKEDQMTVRVPDIHVSPPAQDEDINEEQVEVPQTSAEAEAERKEEPVSEPMPESSSQPTESTSSQPEKLTARRRSVRAASQPRNSPAVLDDQQHAARIKTRRATSEALEPATATPKKERRNSHLFESTAEERLTPTLRMTPMRLARMTASTENLATAGTPTKRSRGASVEPSEVRTPTTRGTRVRSKAGSVAEDMPATPEEEDDNISVVSNTSRRSLRSRRGTAADTDADDAKSTVSSSSRKGTAKSKKPLMETIIPEETEMNEYSSSRRLTRHQQQIMERSMKVQNRMLDTSSSTISPGTPTVEESAESDADSVTSKISRASQQRRSVRARSKESDISESGGSTRSTRSSRLRAPSATAKKKLSAIIEADAAGSTQGESKSGGEEDEGNFAAEDSSTPPKKRGRAKAQK